MSNPFLKSALTLAKKGLPVFPCWPKKKNPIPEHGLLEATTDIETIQKWWTNNPNANVAMRTNVIFVVDIDIDENEGKDGDQSRREWECNHGDFPETVYVNTPRGGTHYYFKRDDPNDYVQSREAVIPDVDVRGDGGYVLVPPSVGPNGKQYTWGETFDNVGIASPNDSVKTLVNYGERNNNGESVSEPFQIPEKIEKGVRNTRLFQLACSLRSKGMVESEIMALISATNAERCVEPLPLGELRTIVSSALKYEPKYSLPYNKSVSDVVGLEYTEKGTLKSTIHNFAMIMRQDPELAGKIKYDVMAYSPKYLGQLPWRSEGDTLGDWSDYDDAALRLYLEHNYGLVGKEKTQDAFRVVVNENKFNPVLDYLRALPPWDGIERMDSLLSDFLGAEESGYNSAVINLLMMAALNRICRPGCKFDHMVVLVGPQGYGKSTFFRRLAINESWFDDNFNTVEGKEAKERLRAKWFLELAELLAVKRQKDVEQIKAFITSQTDSYRESYDRHTVDHPRMCVFVGSTNEKSFLSDRTGNRRFLPVEIGLHQPKRDLFATDTPEWFDKCWAEALYKYQKASEGLKLVLPKGLQQEALAQQERFLAEDPWVGQIQEYLDNINVDTTCALDLWHNAIRQENDLKRSDSNRIHSIMRNDIHGWHEAKRERFDEWGQQIAYHRDTVTFSPVDDAESF